MASQKSVSDGQSLKMELYITLEMAHQELILSFTSAIVRSRSKSATSPESETTSNAVLRFRTHDTLGSALFRHQYFPNGVYHPQNALFGPFYRKCVNADKTGTNRPVSFTVHVPVRAPALNCQPVILGLVPFAAFRKQAEVAPCASCLLAPLAKNDLGTSHHSEQSWTTWTGLGWQQETIGGYETSEPGIIMTLVF